MRAIAFIVMVIATVVVLMLVSGRGMHVFRLHQANAIGQGHAQ